MKYELLHIGATCATCDTELEAPELKTNSVGIVLAVEPCESCKSVFAGLADEELLGCNTTIDELRAEVTLLNERIRKNETV